MDKILNQIVEPILKWYPENARNLPWREGKNPYHIWIAEIMLQQTRIEAVKKYYERFMMQIPDITTLAMVEEEKLLKLWEGLGYYNRAKNLKRAAEKIVNEFGGEMPRTYTELLKLPGIGEYTAGAIASTCFREKVPAVDGNVLRVISRITANKKDVLLPETKKQITEQIIKILPEQVDIFNQALMELGEVICIPNGEPLCFKCPLCEICKAKKQNLIKQIPVRHAKKDRNQVDKTVFCLYYNGKMALQKRNTKGLLAGMYELPNVEGIKKEDKIEEILKNWNLVVKNLKKSKRETHIFTHIEWHMIEYVIEVKLPNTEFLWVTSDELKKYPIPTAFYKLLK